MKYNFTVDTKNKIGTKIWIREIKDGQERVRAYLWTGQDNSATTTYTAVISAHGESALIDGNFPEGKYDLVYYGPHGYILNDPGLKALGDGTLNREVIGPDKRGQDYLLTKYQNKQSKWVETYEDVVTFVLRYGKDVITIKNLYETDWLDQQYKVVKSLFGSGTVEQPNVKTSGIKLSELITLVRPIFPYKEFLCAFCRGGAHWEAMHQLLGRDSSHTPTSI